MNEFETNIQKVVHDVESTHKMVQTIYAATVTNFADDSLPSEDFSEFDEMLPIKNDESLTDFEQKLLDQDFRGKFLRFLTIKHRDHLQNGPAIFKTVIRQLTATELFLPFSWKGHNHLQQNYSFKIKHAIFVELIKSFIGQIDPKCCATKVEELFINHLRLKKIDHKRETQRRESRTVKRAGFVDDSPRKIAKSDISYSTNTLNDENKENVNLNF